MGVPFYSAFCFSNAIKNKTGMRMCRRCTAKWLLNERKTMNRHLAGIDLTSFETVSQRRNSAYTDYFYPQPMDNHRVMVTKSGIGDIETLVVLGP